MGFLVAIINILSIPLMILNTLGWLVAGIWLAALGAWYPLIIGVVAFFCATWVISLALIPSVGIQAGGAALLEKGHTIPGWALLFLGNLYVVAIVTIWCVGSLVFFMAKATPSSLIPMLIWSYSVAVGPWEYMAHKEGPDATGSQASVFFAQLGYLILMLLVYFVNIRIIDAVIVFSVVMIIDVFVMFALAVVMIKENKLHDVYYQ